MLSSTVLNGMSATLEIILWLEIYNIETLDPFPGKALEAQYPSSTEVEDPLVFHIKIIGMNFYTFKLGTSIQRQGLLDLIDCVSALVSLNKE